MPWKPKRPCGHSGCPNLSDESYCEIHREGVRTAANRQYNDNVRDCDMQKFYISTAWRTLRRLKLSQSPVCEECFKRKRVSEAVIADHILPAREYPSRRLDIDNLQSLCRACHNRKHGGG